jgi:hypothetical protein
MPTLLQTKMAQQGKQMSAGALRASAYILPKMNCSATKRDLVQIRQKMG